MAQTIVSSPFTDNRMSLAVTHTSHGFDSNDIGKAVRSSGTDGQFVVARANTAANAEVVGVITSIEGDDNYTITTSGFVDVVAAVPTATAGTVFFLAEAADSQLTSTEPTTAGAVSKPVAVITESDAKMLLIHYRGEVLTSTTQTNAPNDATYVTTTSNSSLTNEVLASALKIDDFAAGDDNTDLDSSASRHGLLRKLDGTATNFLNGAGNWAAAGSNISCRAISSGTQSLTNNTYEAVILNGTDVFDVTNMHDPSSNNTRIIFATAGTYLLVGHVIFAASNNGIRNIEFMANGSTRFDQVQENTPHATEEVKMVNTAIYTFAANEYVELRAKQNRGSALNINTCELSAVKILG